MRGSFDIADRLDTDNARFRLGADEIQQLPALLCKCQAIPGTAH